MTTGPSITESHTEGKPNLVDYQSPEIVCHPVKRTSVYLQAKFSVYLKFLFFSLTLEDHQHTFPTGPNDTTPQYSELVSINTTTVKIQK